MSREVTVRCGYDDPASGRCRRSATFHHVDCIVPAVMKALVAEKWRMASSDDSRDLCPDHGAHHGRPPAEDTAPPMDPLW